MSKRKTKKIAPTERDGSSSSAMPPAPLHLPAHPPRANPMAFFIAFTLFLLWFAYLVIVARWG